ncbi:oxepin-CoA hydrolase, alternative type [Granulicoccus phenolivorans]|uniref:oxepin-CoA hydrolase, alternative type n=1 Tax=Granulicoccus phenolivorans TaxID=266854 RepID=UPI0003FDED77|nr:enoyl-CoA hydratase family protein [Granulicoccus phenolivorans]
MTVLTTRTIGSVRVLEINNPTTRNAVGPDFFEEAETALGAAEADPGIGAIVLTGASGTFSSGGNLRALAGNRDKPAAERRERIELLHGLIRRIDASPLPIVAAVEGAAAGAGMSLALACDLIVAARTAFFSASYIRAGLSPDGGLTALLTESLPRQAVTELCLLGERVPAERMHELGVVNRLVDTDGAEQVAVELATRLAGGPARATARIKTLVRTSTRHTLHEQLDLEAAAMVLSQGDDEAAEGIAAVLERRPAEFPRPRRTQSAALTESEVR